MRVLRWTPPETVDSPAIVMEGNEGPLVLVSISGESGNSGEIGGRSAPGQYGETPSFTKLHPRVIDVIAAYEASSPSDLAVKRASLQRALAAFATGPNQRPELGTLLIRQDGREDLEIKAFPVRSPQVIKTDRTKTLQWYEITFVCPDPRWAAVQDIESVLSQTGAFEFPLEHPWTSGSLNITVEITNPGDVPAPIIARLEGEFTNVRLINQRTGEILSISGETNVGEYLLVNTNFGQKSVTLHSVDDDSLIGDAMDRVDLDNADFWSLLPGLQVISVEADENLSGLFSVTWRPHFAGA